MLGSIARTRQVAATARIRSVQMPRWALYTPRSAPSVLPRASVGAALRNRPVASFGTTAETSDKRSAAASTARWTAAVVSAVVGVYTIDRYSLFEQTPTEKPVANNPEESQTQASGLTNVQALALGYGVCCTSMVVGWRFWRSLRPIGSYLGDVRASPNGFLHWRGGQPKMFSVDNALGRTFLGTTGAGLLLLGAALLDGRADDDNDQK